MKSTALLLLLLASFMVSGCLPEEGLGETPTEVIDGDGDDTTDPTDPVDPATAIENAKAFINSYRSASDAAQLAYFNQNFSDSFVADAEELAEFYEETAYRFVETLFVSTMAATLFAEDAYAFGERGDVEVGYQWDINDFDEFAESYLPHGLVGEFSAAN
ncbi:hypothetical protein NFC81_06390 [Salinispirillum sp. LH 10-3-1]|uniref:DUF3887 domain-containing protein n=1 Tax=Salinispirillum sp. LH 10-3-1 TaxID=2952525 RepID=A0AB38YJF4_9GAMM